MRDKATILKAQRCVYDKKKHRDYTKIKQVFHWLIATADVERVCILCSVTWTCHATQTIKIGSFNWHAMLCDTADAQ